MFDVETLRRTIAEHGPTARVVIAGVEGSSPREVGASMLVWKDGQSGTIGGGALEWQAIATARTLPGTRLDRVPLGPALGQCCGGAVTLLTETYGVGGIAPGLPSPPAPLPGGEGGGTAGAALCSAAPRSGRERGPALPPAPPSPLGEGPGERDFRAQVLPLPGDTASGLFARSLDGRPMPLAVKRIIDRARAQGVIPAPTLLQGWFVEPVARPTRHLWIWGAGHVGRALVNVMAPLPGLAVTWVDVAADRFPDTIPPGVTMLPAADPAALVPHAPPQADHLILTYSHALDLDLCHRLLTHGFATAGLIGSATKWARFRSRLAALGHTPHSIARIRCPIGDPGLGKHPQAIAIGVATTFLNQAQSTARQEIAG